MRGEGEGGGLVLRDVTQKSARSSIKIVNSHAKPTVLNEMFPESSPLTTEKSYKKLRTNPDRFTD